MINTLHIKNIGIIDDLSIDLNQGFNVLTGETGAGKTLIIDSLSILAGGRFSKEMIRKGEKYSFVEMSLELNNTEFTENQVIVSREINENGKNMCKINGRMVTVSELKNFMKNIIDIHGQHDNQSLLENSTHIKLLDEFAGKELKIIKEQYIKKYKEYNKLKLELNRNYGDDKEKQRKLDLLRYQEKEILDAKLKENEEEDLENKRKIIMSSEKIQENLNQVDIQLSENTIDSINIAIRSLEKIEDLDEKYKNISENLKSIYYDLKEISIDVNNLKNENEFDEENRNEIENRLDLIYSLKRKYGNNILEILKYREKVSKEIFDIENLEEYTNKLKQEIQKLKLEMLELSNKLHKIRVEVSKKLNTNINYELVDLEMKNSKFIVDIKFNENEEFNENGLDKVEFLISTNIGEDYKELTKIASGGEMSRIMLAIKTVLADVDEVPVLVFDEIDTGISGIAANSVGNKMKMISKKHQVICITHLATIAAKGDFNYYISKKVIEDKTKTTIKLLNEEEIINEIARISTGNITEISLKHARELRKLGVLTKNENVV